LTSNVAIDFVPAIPNVTPDIPSNVLPDVFINATPNAITSIIMNNIS